MKTLRILTLMMCLAVLCPVWAGVVSETQARQVANRFMSSRSINTKGMRLAHKAPSFKSGAATPYYVFNAGERNGGFVIVAGDDRAPQVLAYSDKGYFDAQEVPVAMQDLLDDYAEQMAALAEGGYEAAPLRASAPIAPLVPCVWSQNSPYNIKLPFMSTGKHAAVGCVATAMAQVMYYWRYPQRSSVIPGYTTETNSIAMPSLPAVDFDWDAMQNTYLTSDTTSAAGQAAALLSLYCAQAVEMDFLKNSSSAAASDIPLSMFMYFGYSPNSKYLQRKFFTTEQWESMILSELEAKRPVIYRGRKLSGGHAYVCDGYDGNGRFHINWGWNGQSNGYFLLNVLNPDLQGTGSASGTYGYIIDQAMIYGLQPGGYYDGAIDVTARSISLQSYNGTRTSSNGNFTASLSTQYANYMDDAIDFDYGWGLYEGDEMLKVLDQDTRYNLQSWYYTTIERTLSFGSGLSNGTYRIKPIYSPIFENDWKPCIGAEVNYIEVKIMGNSCVLICHGLALTSAYQLDGIDVKGNMHPGRPIDIDVRLTNLGNTRNDMVYMFADGEFTAAGFIDLEKNQSGTVALRYMPDKAGTVSLKFTLDEEGTRELATKQITIEPMPAALLTGTATPLNVTDAANKIMTANDFGVQLVVTNKGTTTYDEDISIKMYKRTQGTSGSLVQAASQRVQIAPNESITLTFHLDNVVDGWKYFAKTYYYSQGDQISLASVSTHTIVFPAATIPGDVNGDGEVSIADINAVIDLILRGEQSLSGDVNGDGEVTIADINAVIDIIIAG